VAKGNKQRRQLSPRSRLGKNLKTNLNTKTDGTTEADNTAVGTLPEWAKNLPEYITVATWEIIDLKDIKKLSKSDLINLMRKKINKLLHKI